MLLVLLLLSASGINSMELSEDISPRIAGGEIAEYTPWIAALSYGDVAKGFQCSASVITNRHILTAAHCVESAYINGSLVSSYMVTVGTNTRNGTGQNYSIIKNYTHPEFSLYYVKNDIGILVTNTTIEFSELVRSVTLNFRHIGGGVPVIVLGWGSQSARGTPSINLQELEMTTVNTSYCLQEIQRVGKKFHIYPPYIDEQKELCAYRAPGQGTCKGDSGSPLVCAATDQQMGLTSWGIPCAHGAPDVFTRISNYKDWILSVLAIMDYEDQLNYTMEDCS